MVPAVTPPARARPSSEQLPTPAGLVGFALGTCSFLAAVPLVWLGLWNGVFSAGRPGRAGSWAELWQMPPPNDAIDTAQLIIIVGILGVLAGLAGLAFAAKGLATVRAGRKRGREYVVWAFRLAGAGLVVAAALLIWVWPAPA